jgi:hypothetical protein
MKCIEAGDYWRVLVKMVGGFKVFSSYFLLGIEIATDHRPSV